MTERAGRFHSAPAVDSRPNPTESEAVRTTAKLANRLSQLARDELRGAWQFLPTAPAGGPQLWEAANLDLFFYVRAFLAAAWLDRADIGNFLPMLQEKRIRFFLLDHQWLEAATTGDLQNSFHQIGPNRQTISA